MNHLEVVKLAPLMALTSGRPETVIGLIDGPVIKDHPELVSKHIHELSGSSQRPGRSAANLHGTFIAGMLSAKRSSAAPAICPNCTLLVRPLFTGETVRGGLMPSATPQELAAAIYGCIEAGAHVLNLSVALVNPSSQDQSTIEEALNHAASRGVLVVAAAGNQGMMGSSILTRHPWVISVGACDLAGRPTWYSNLGSSLGRRGLRAPGEEVASLGASGQIISLSGTSVATPFVTGAIALLHSAFPTATASEIRFALSQGSGQRRTTVVPPLLDAWTAYHTLLTTYPKTRVGGSLVGLWLPY